MPRPEAQMRSLIRGHIDGITVSPGSVFWTTAARARQLIADKLAEPAGRVNRPNETPRAGPTETKETVPEKRRLLRRNDGWPLDRFSTVQRIYSGAVVCAATGPSLSEAQLEQVRAAGLPLLVVNDAYRIAPWADCVYFADFKWWKWQVTLHKAAWDAFPGERCSVWTTANRVDDDRVHFLRRMMKNGVPHDWISTDPQEIATGANSGYQVINLATLGGANPVILIGFDAHGESQKGMKKDHYFGAHPDGTAPVYGMVRQRMAILSDAAKTIGVRILNATPGTALDCFEKVDLAACLQSHT